MLRKTLMSTALLALIVTALGAAPAEAADGRYLVVLEESKTDQAANQALIESLGGTVYRDLSEIGVLIVRSDEPNFDRRLKQARGVIDVTPDVRRETNWSRQLESMNRVPIVSGPPERTAPEVGRNGQSNWGGHHGGGPSLPDVTTLPFWPFQWNMQILGLEELFNEQNFYGDPRVEVAVVGAGIDYRHPDLAGRVDLDKSRSFVESDDILVQQLFPGEHPVADLAFHTTHAASQIACNFTNLSCVAPNVTLVGIKVLDLNEFGTIGDVVSGIKYAGDIRADIIAIPFAMWGPSYPQWEKIWNYTNPEDRADIKAMKRAILWAKLRGAAVLSDVSVPFFGFGIDADNDGWDVILPVQAGATGVGCSGSQDVWCEVSNYGFSLVDVVAPGGWVDPVTEQIPPEENVWGACSSFTQGALVDDCAIENQPQYIIIIGPQPAVGHAAGVAALIDSRFRGHLPGFLVDAWLRVTSADIGTPGRDAFTGWGRVDALNAAGH